MTNRGSILKSRDITLLTKICQSYDFSSIYVCESWTIKKAEYERIDASELWCWRRLLRVPWTARRSNQSILKEIFVTPWTIAYKAPLSMEFSRQEYLSVLPFPWKKSYDKPRQYIKKQGHRFAHKTPFSWLKAQHSENEDHGIRSHHFMGNRWGNSGHSVRLYFWGLPNHCRW